MPSCAPDCIYPYFLIHDQSFWDLRFGREGGLFWNKHVVTYDLTYNISQRPKSCCIDLVSASICKTKQSIFSQTYPLTMVIQNDWIDSCSFPCFCSTLSPS